ncbi:Midasin, partial [Stegodyphus mimosarum]
MSVINLLQQCLEDSPLGEFPARLSILFTFLLQYRISNSNDLAEIVYNVYSYYIQFLPSVNNHIAQLRKPIEKEMKDYVKIARWNDMNFYSVKQSVQKSHRCIIKHIKTFEDALKKPAKNFFTLPSKINESESSPWSLDIKPEDFMSSQTKLPKLVAQRKETLFKKLPMYHKKAKKLSERVSNNFPVIDHINRLNDLCGNIIEALQSVTSDAVKTVLTRSREKKQTLLNIQTKRQMLSTLFKNLRVMGLSFRQGIIYQKRVNMNEVFSIPAFDPLSLQVLEIDLKFKELLLKSSSETSHYFCKNIAQYAHLQKSMESPCKDLTLDMIHRIQGYSGHLMQFITLQRQKIVKISKDVDAVGCFLATLSAFNKEQQTSGVKKNLTVLPPQNVMLEWEGLLCNYLVQFIVSVGQFRALMECAPSSAEMTSDLSVISSSLSANPLPSIDKKDSIWSGISTAYDHCATDIRKQLVLLSDVLNTTHVYGTWHQFSWVGACFTSMQSAARQIMSVVKEAEYNAENCFTKNLSSLYSKICQETKNVTKSCATIVQEAETSTSRTNNKQNRILSRLCQKLTKEVLLAFQDMVKLCLQSDDNNQAEDIDVVSENLFTVRISASIDEIERCLRIENIKQIVNKLKKHIGLFQNSIEDLKSIDDSLRLLINLTPFLNQYYHLLKVYMAVILGMHRTSNKFLSILLEIFNILATKGFCIPPELQEEAKKYGATKFEDIEGGGLGEGEGTKDVSGNIETEDQLEDAFKEGQEKEDSDQKSKEIKEEEEGIEMSNDFEGKTHNPDEQDEEIEKSEDEEDLEKKMGDVDTSDAEKLDEKIWGSDSEDEDEEEDLKEESESGGVTENKESELVAKDGEYKKDDYEKHKDKRAEEFCPDTEDEYKEDIPDPLIDTAPQQEPEGLDLPDNMEIKDDYKENEDLEETEGDTNMEDIQDDGDTENEDEGSNAENEQKETEEGNDIPSNNVDSKDDIEGCNSAEPVEENEEMEIASDDQRNDLLPTHTPTSEEAIASADNAKSSSHDPVQCKETPMEWESGAQDVKEQHREGQADSTVSQSEDFGHEGKKSSAAVRKTGDDQQNKSKLKQPDENRVVDDSSTDKNVKHKPIVEKQSLKNSLGPDPETSADMYEHVSKKEEGVAQAVDIATEEQAAARPVQDQSESASDNEEVIEISSGDDEEEHPRAQGDSVHSDQRKKPGEKGEIGERDKKMEITEGEVVKTLTVPRGLESTIHTQNDIWRHLSSVNQQGLRLKMEKDLDLFCHAGKEQTISSGQLWRNYEILVSSLAQELCEQLRLVLEPTKMSKLKGDYRTGKRLNMRKIIPYIASDFRKDKIWLRRTKPSKRQYQIMLAVDDSSSMADNHSKQLAFESLAVLGQSLSLLEAGEISVVSFGEKVELLLGFNEQFSSITGSRIIEQFSFSQKRTNYSQMLNYATDAFVQARSNSRFTTVSKEIAQLLIIISDGRGIYREGEKVMKNAVRRARDNNIFMVFIVLDSPSNEHSILDIKCPVFEANQLKEMKCYMENFPFPFYIILRDISSLPLVLGEALRQWFELVTSVER